MDKIAEGNEMAAHVAANVARKRTHPGINGVEFFNLGTEPDVVDDLLDGLCLVIGIVWTITRHDNAGRVIAIRSHIGFDGRLGGGRFFVFSDGCLIDVAIVFDACRKLTNHVGNALELGLPLFAFGLKLGFGIEFAEAIIARDPAIRKILQVELVEDTEDGSFGTAIERRSMEIVE